MEINPYDARMRILQAQDGVQMQREAAPDDELAGCPGCPYYWTCPVPHRGEKVNVAPEIELEDVAEQIGPRGEYRPRDAEDIGWTDEWVEVDEPGDEDDGEGTPTEDARGTGRRARRDGEVRGAPRPRGRLGRLFRRG